jgi:hypothetical protein
MNSDVGFSVRPWFQKTVMDSMIYYLPNRAISEVPQMSNAD